MNVLVTHPSLNRGGGAERVCLTVVKVLKEKGHVVTLATVEKTAWGFLEERFGELSRPQQEIYIVGNIPTKSKFLQGITTLPFYVTELLRLCGSDRYDVSFNTYGDLVNSIADISYVNALPARITHHFSDSGFHSSVTWKAIPLTYSLISTVADYMFKNSAIFTNSIFMQKIIRKYLGYSASVIYPPVNTTRFRYLSQGDKRENLIASISRLRPGKRLDIIPIIAKLATEGRFVVTGLADEGSQETVQKFSRTIKELGIEKHVQLLVNQSAQALTDLLASAKVFLQTQPMEAFGISVVEAMAAGCVPVVSRDGGPWFDILEEKEGVYGFSYGSISEAAEKIRMLLENDELRTEVSARARRRALDFDSSVFESKILSVVKKVYSRKFE
jgi:glycosyltransferase involved in cell wall biosynthesis